MADNVRHYEFSVFDDMIGADFLSVGPYQPQPVSADLGRVLSKGEIRHDIDYVFDGAQFRLADPTQFRHLMAGEQQEIIVEFTRHYADGSTTDNRFHFEIDGADPAPEFSIANTALIVSEGEQGPLSLGLTIPSLPSEPVPDPNANPVNPIDSVLGAISLSHNAPLTINPERYQLTLVGGADWSAFRYYIGDHSNDEIPDELMFRRSPDFERPVDANGDNVYEVEVALFRGHDQISDPIPITVEVQDSPSTAPFVDARFDHYNQTFLWDSDQLDIPLQDLLSNVEAGLTINDAALYANVFIQLPYDWWDDFSFTNALLLENQPWPTNAFDVSFTGDTFHIRANNVPTLVDGTPVPFPGEFAIGFVLRAEVDGLPAGEEEVLGEFTIWLQNEETYLASPKFTLTDHHLLHEEGIEVVELPLDDLTENGWVSPYPLYPYQRLEARPEIVGGADADLFSTPRIFDGGAFVISGEGDLKFHTPPDFNNPMDANGDNVYEVDLAFRNELVSSQTATLFIEVVSFDPADNANPALSVGDVVPIVPGTYESIEFFL